jgi:hypothetical protein
MLSEQLFCSDSFSCYLYIYVSTALLEDAGSEVLTAVAMKSTIFWDITPSSPLKVNRSLLATFFHAGSFSAYSSTLKMEAICSSRTSVNFQRATRR